MSAQAHEMSLDRGLQDKALEVLVEADSHRWIHQSTWFGEPVLNLPQDMFALQEIIWRTRPEFIIEVGVAWGGGLLFGINAGNSWRREGYRRRCFYPG